MNASDSESNATVAVERIATADVSVRARLADIAGDDGEFIAELINAFLTGSEDSRAELRAAATAGDANAIARAAHKIKGAAANLHLDGLAAIALSLEERGRANENCDWSASLGDIERELDRVAAALRGELEVLETELRCAG